MSISLLLLKTETGVKSEEARYYLGIIAAVTALIVWNAADVWNLCAGT